MRFYLARHMHSGCIGLYLGIKPGKIVHCHCHLPLHTNGYRSLYFSISGFSQIELRLGLLCHYFQQNTFQTGWAGQKKKRVRVVRTVREVVGATRAREGEEQSVNL